MTPERVVAAQVSLMSCQVGSHSMRLASRMHLVSFSALVRISLMAKSPMMMGTKSMPAMSSTEPKVSRATPVSGSRPIMAVSSPKSADRSPLPRSSPGQAYHQAQAEEGQGEVLRRTEGQRGARQHRCEESEADHAHGAGGKRGQGGYAQGRPAAALEVELVALHGRGHGGGFAGDVHQDRGGRAAVHGSVVYGRHHDDGRAPGPGARRAAAAWRWPPSAPGPAARPPAFRQCCRSGRRAGCRGSMRQQNRPSRKTMLPL